MGENMLIMLNASHEKVDIQLPAGDAGLPSLEVLLNTANPKCRIGEHNPKHAFELQGRSLALFRWPFS